MGELLTTRQVASRLGVIPRRVQQMITDGFLPARKFGHIYVVDEDDLARVKDRKSGRAGWGQYDPPAAQE